MTEFKERKKLLSTVKAFLNIYWYQRKSVTKMNSNTLNVSLGIAAKFHF